MSVTVRIQRYEYSNGVGPYTSMNHGEKPADAPSQGYWDDPEPLGNFSFEEQDEYYMEHQPQPSYDDLGWRWLTRGHKFGFANSQERRAWFSRISHRRLKRCGVQLVEYTLALTDPEQIELGKHQLAFDPDAVIERKVLT